MLLHLLGSKKWWGKAFLIRFGKESCELSGSETLTLYAECIEAVRIIAMEIKEHIERGKDANVKAFLGNLLGVFEHEKIGKLI
jgi:serine/threonine-protein kinase HipA